MKLPGPSTAIVVGHFNSAELPTPSARPLVEVSEPPPTKDMTVRVAMSTLRMFMPKPYSATYSVPLESNATPTGWKNCAAAPTPFVTPCVPLPASVETSPDNTSTARTRQLNVSATYTLPIQGIDVRPTGTQKVAATPTPSALPYAVPPGVPPPASVATEPVDTSIERMTLLLLSAQ